MIELNRERKVILGIGVLLLVLGGIYRFGPAMPDFGTGKDEIDLKKRVLAKYRQRLNTRNQLDERLLALSRILEREKSRFLTGETEALAAVDIQNTLNTITRKNNVEISSLQVLKAGEFTPPFIVSIPVQFVLQATVEQLNEILYNIESSSKMLRIVFLRCQVVNRKAGEKIQATLTVEGFMEKKAGDK